MFSTSQIMALQICCLGWQLPKIWDFTAENAVKVDNFLSFETVYSKYSLSRFGNKMLEKLST